MCEARNEHHAGLFLSFFVDSVGGCVPILAKASQNSPVMIRGSQVSACIPVFPQDTRASRSSQLLTVFDRQCCRAPQNKLYRQDRIDKTAANETIVCTSEQVYKI